MRSEDETEAPLTAEDVRKILSICSPRGLLVGGQALHKVRWPQIVAEVGAKRDSLRKLASKSTSKPRRVSA